MTVIAFQLVLIVILVLGVFKEKKRSDRMFRYSQAVVAKIGLDVDIQKPQQWENIIEQYIIWRAHLHESRVIDHEWEDKFGENVRKHLGPGLARAYLKRGRPTMTDWLCPGEIPFEAIRHNCEFSKECPEDHICADHICQPFDCPHIRHTAVRREKHGWCRYTRF